MRTAARLGAFGVVLAGAFGVAWGVGAAVDPIATPDAEHATSGDDAGGAAPSVTGLSVAASGYRLAPESDLLAIGDAAPFRFRVLVEDGEGGEVAVTAFDETHERDLHLIVVRQDLTGFQHVHPTMAADGTWTIDLAVDEPGAHRLYAEFRPTGDDESTVLSTTAFAPGSSTPTPIGGEARASRVDDYELTLSGELTAGTTSEVAVEVHRDGAAVTDLQPYLGAAGHLVALRAGDLAYAHVHPVGDFDPGPLVRFAVEVPTAGTYRLFLDFQHDGVVRTAAFTVAAAPRDGDAGAHDGDGSTHDEGGHG